MTEGARPGVSRRTVVAGLVAAVLPAAGCGIRLEDDAPRVPLVPTRTPVPAEAELVALTRDTAALAELASTVPGAVAADLATIHRRQHTVLRSTLLAGQVPAADLDAGPSTAPSAPSPSTSAAPSAAPTASPSGTRVELAAAEGASAAAAGTFAGVEPDLRATMASLHAQRYAAATLLAGQPPRVPDGAVAGADVAALADATAAADLLPGGRGREVDGPAAGQGRRHAGGPARPARRPAGRRCGCRGRARPPAALPGREPHRRQAPGPHGPHDPARELRRPPRAVGDLRGRRRASPP